MLNFWTNMCKILMPKQFPPLGAAALAEFFEKKQWDQFYPVQLLKSIVYSTVCTFTGGLRSQLQSHESCPDGTGAGASFSACVWPVGRSTGNAGTARASELAINDLDLDTLNSAASISGASLASGSSLDLSEIWRDPCGSPKGFGANSFASCTAPMPCRAKALVTAASSSESEYFFSRLFEAGS